MRRAEVAFTRMRRRSPETINPRSRFRFPRELNLVSGTKRRSTVSDNITRQDRLVTYTRVGMHIKRGWFDGGWPSRHRRRDSDARRDRPGAQLRAGDRSVGGDQKLAVL